MIYIYNILTSLSSTSTTDPLRFPPAPIRVSLCLMTLTFGERVFAPQRFDNFIGYPSNFRQSTFFDVWRKSPTGRPSTRAFPPSAGDDRSSTSCSPTWPRGVRATDTPLVSKQAGRAIPRSEFHAGDPLLPRVGPSCAKSFARGARRVALRKCVSHRSGPGRQISASSLISASRALERKRPRLADDGCRSCASPISIVAVCINPVRAAERSSTPALVALANGRLPLGGAADRLGAVCGSAGEPTSGRHA